MIKNLQINNYKSIRQLDLNCSRINILVGQPNVGKSNILEALDLSYLSSMLSSNEALVKENKEQIDIKEYFRVEKAADMFHFGDLSKPIIVRHPGFSFDTHLEYNTKKNSIDGDEDSFFELGNSNGGLTKFDNDFISKKGTQFFGSPFKPYRYKEGIQFHDIGNYIDKLMPPFGNNLLEVIKYNADIKDFIEELTKDSGFEFSVDIASHTLAVQIRVNKGLVYSLPFHAIADTIRRILFYVAAIRHNNAWVITLEEPEVHSFPKYISFLADEIIASHNQFFVATHSPYLLNSLIENTPLDELAVFVCGYNKEEGTMARKLSTDDLSELLDYGVDIFFNINRYLNDGVEHSS